MTCLNSSAATRRGGGDINARLRPSPPTISPPLQPPKLRQQLFGGRGRLVAVEVFVRQDFVTKNRFAVFLGFLPTNDRLGDFPVQEGFDVFAIRDVFVVLHVMPVRPFGLRLKRVKESFDGFLLV